MNNKGQTDGGFKFIIIAAVAILVGLAFWGTIGDSIGVMTKTYDHYNFSVTLPAEGASTEVAGCGQKIVSITITNRTDGAVVPSTNYTTSQAVAAGDGYLIAKIAVTKSDYKSQAVNVSCNYQSRGYIEEGGTRGIVVLIAVFLALLIMIAAMPDLRNSFFDAIKGR